MGVERRGEVLEVFYLHVVIVVGVHGVVVNVVASGWRWNCCCCWWGMHAVAAAVIAAYWFCCCWFYWGCWLLLVVLSLLLLCVVAVVFELSSNFSLKPFVPKVSPDVSIGTH